MKYLVNKRKQEENQDSESSNSRSAISPQWNSNPINQTAPNNLSTSQN